MVSNTSFRLFYVGDLICYRLCHRLAAINLRQVIGTDLFWHWMLRIIEYCTIWTIKHQ